MTTPVTTDIGEEYVWTGNADGDTITLLLFEDAVDDVDEETLLDDLTTEPDDGEDYERQSVTVSTSQLDGSGGGDFGFSNDSEVTFTLDSNEETIDAVGYVATFESEVAGDTEPEEHLIAADELDPSFDLSEFQSFELSYDAGDLEHFATGATGGV